MINCTVEKHLWNLNFKTYINGRGHTIIGVHFVSPHITITIMSTILQIFSVVLWHRIKIIYYVVGTILCFCLGHQKVLRWLWVRDQTIGNFFFFFLVESQNDPIILSVYLYYFNNQYENKMTSYWAGPRFKAWTVFWFKFVWRALNLVWTNVKMCFWSLDLTLCSW